MNKFVMKDLGEISSFHDIQLINKDDIICTDQLMYLTNVLRGGSEFSSKKSSYAK